MVRFLPTSGSVVVDRYIYRDKHVDHRSVTRVRKRLKSVGLRVQEKGRARRTRLLNSIVYRVLEVLFGSEEDVYLFINLRPFTSCSFYVVT